MDDGKVLRCDVLSAGAKVGDLLEGGQGQQTWVMNSVRNPDGTVPTAYKLTSPPGAHMFPTWGEIKAKCGEKHDQDDEEN